MTDTGNKRSTFRERLRTPGSFAADVATLGLGTTIGQLSVVLAAPLLSRLFTADDFGQLQFIVSVSLILASFSTLRYELAIPLSRSFSSAISVLILSLSLSATVATLVCFVILLDLPIVNDMFSSSMSNNLILFVPLILILEASNNVFSYWFTRTKEFKVPSVARSLFGVNSSLMQIMLALVGFLNGLGLIIGYIFGQISSAVWNIYRFQISREPIRKSDYSISGIRSQALKHKYFPLFSSWNILLNTLARNLPSILLVSYFSITEAGLYAIGIRLMNLPLNILGNSVGQVFYRQLLTYIDNKLRLLPLLASTAAKLAGIIVLPLIVVFFWGDDLFGLILGQNWVMAGEIAGLMVPFYLMRFISSPISTIFSATNKQYLSLIWQLFYALGTFSSFYFTRMQADFIYSIKIYSLMGSVLFLVLFGMILFTGRQADKKIVL